jgi:hypothetical protein
MRPDLDVFLMVESAIFALNAAGWEYNDLPQLAYDPNLYAWFLLDCSAAFRPEKWQHGWHGDRTQVQKWFGLMGLDRVLALRKRGQHVHHAVQLPAFNDPSEEPYNVEDAFYPLEEEERRRHEYIYASTNRPLSALWFKVDGTCILRADLAQSPRVHSWLVSTRPLDDDTLERFELTMAYSPWP